MEETGQEVCGKCGAEIDPSRRVDFALKDGTRVCEPCSSKKLRGRRGQGMIGRTKATYY